MMASVTKAITHDALLSTEEEDDCNINETRLPLHLQVASDLATHTCEMQICLLHCAKMRKSRQAGNILPRQPRRTKLTAACRGASLRLPVLRPGAAAYMRGAWGQRPKGLSASAKGHQ
jgi:hypothetical protein